MKFTIFVVGVFVFVQITEFVQARPNDAVKAAAAVYVNSEEDLSDSKKGLNGNKNRLMVIDPELGIVGKAMQVIDKTATDLYTKRLIHQVEDAQRKYHQSRDIPLKPWDRIFHPFHSAIPVGAGTVGKSAVRPGNMIGSMASIH